MNPSLATEPVYSESYTEDVHARIVAAALDVLENYAAQQEQRDSGDAE